MKNRDDLQQEIVNYVDREETVKLCQELVKFPSENPPCNISGIIGYVTGFLRDTGINYEIIEEAGKPVVISSIGADSVGKTLLLNGHLDVVPAGNRDKWDFPPFSGERKDGYILGRGTSDMKGGIAGLLASFKALSLFLREKGGNNSIPGQVILTLVPDEETGGHYGSRLLADKFAGIADGCLIAEPSRANPTVGQKGSLWVKVITRGESGHGSLSPVAGDNAVMKMTRVLKVIESIWDREWELPVEIRQLVAGAKRHIRREQGKIGIERILDHVTVNVGKIKGGDKVNVIPDYCETEVDMRLPFGVKSEQVLKYIEEGLEERSLRAEIKPLRWSSEANYTLPEEDIVESVVRCGRRYINQNCEPTLQWASSDARYFRNKGIPTIQFGPAELQGIHSCNERVSVEELKKYAEVYAAIIVDFLYR